MSASDKCPKCGLQSRFGNSDFWGCGTPKRTMERTHVCYQREILNEREIACSINKHLEDSLIALEKILVVQAANRRHMQIAGPARQCLRIVRDALNNNQGLTATVEEV